jgi:uncharacterized phage-associated protein
MTKGIIHPTAKTYSALAVANELIQLSRERGQPIILADLQQMMYLACGWYVSRFGVPLIETLLIASAEGPEILALTEEFGHYGTTPIQSLAKRTEPYANQTNLISLPKEDTQVHNFLSTFWQFHSNLQPRYIKEVVHSNWGPWRLARAGVETGRKIVIHQDVLRAHFFRIAAISKNRE